MNISKSVIFQAAHTRAKSVHQKGDCYAVTFGAALKAVYADMRANNIKLSKATKVTPRPAVITRKRKVKTEKAIVLQGLRDALEDDGSFKAGDDVSEYNVTFMQLLEYTGITGSCQLATLKELQKLGAVSFYKVNHGYDIYLKEPY